MMIPEHWLYNGLMQGRTPKDPATEHGERLAALRKAAGLTQTDVAKKLGIPQRTVSFYERKARQIPHELVQPLAHLFGVTPEEILGLEGAKPKKRGPKSKLERLFEKASQLPKAKQEFITKLLGEILGTSINP